MGDFTTRTDPAIERTVWPWGVALLRVVVGIVFFMHGQQKLFDIGVAQTGEFFDSQGIPFPAVAAVVVTAVETLGGLALIFGLFTRVAAALLAIDMLVAALVVHVRNGFFAPNGGVELVLVLGAASLALILTGPGALAVDGLLPIERGVPSRGRWGQQDFAR
jgi:putative oxidoreductase